MEKNKKAIIIIIISIIVILLGGLLYYVINNMVYSNIKKNIIDINSTTTTTTTKTTFNYDCFKEKLSTRCIVYENDSIKLVSTKNNGNYNLFINGIYIGDSYQGISNINTIENKYIYFDNGEVSSNYEIYDLKGTRLFTNISEIRRISNIEYDSNEKKLFITYDAISSEGGYEEECDLYSNYEYITETYTIKYENNTFSKPILTSVMNFDDYVQKKYGKLCNADESGKMTLTLEQNQCINNLGRYYSSINEYVINGVFSNNKKYSFRYTGGAEGEHDYYLNEELFDKKEASELVLSKVCNYENYLIISRGWEGYPSIDIYNSNGNKKLSYYGEFEYINDLLNVSEYNYNNGSNDNFYTMTSYSLDLKNNNFEKKNIRTEKISCAVDDGYYC